MSVRPKAPGEPPPHWTDYLKLALLGLMFSMVMTTGIVSCAKMQVRFVEALRNNS